MSATTTASTPTIDRTVFQRGMRLVVSYVRMHPKPFAASVGGAVLFAFASLWLTESLGRATDEVLRPAFEGDLDTSKIWVAAGALMIGGIGRAFGVMLRRYYSGVAGERVMATLRTRVAERYRELSLRYHRETPTGELLAHMEADVKAAVDVFWPVPFAVGVIVLTALALIALLTTDPVLALVGLVVFPSLAIMNQIFARRMEEPSRLAQERIGDVSAVAHESIDGALVVKTLGREHAETQRLFERARALRDERVRAGSIRASFEAALDALPTLAIALLLAVGSWRVSSGAITLGDLIGFVALFQLLSWPMRFIGWILAELPRAVVGYDRIEEVFREPVTVAQSRESMPLPDGPLGLRVHDLRLEYEQESPVLEGVAFEVSPGESVAIVGPTGVGKSTLTQLMVRLVDPDEGRVEIGGIDLRQVDAASLRSAVAVVFQESFLFAESVRSNIALDSGASDDEVEHAAVIAACDRFIRALPDGYDTVVGERGHTLSGGERQRVALARALVRTPRLLILDDATSAVDPSIEAEILGALRRELSTTLVVVAYRLSTIRLADRVIFLRKGRVEATGSHEELLRSQPGYASIIRAYERGERS
ncbi:MAG: ABC transporter ATP-binding protein/permease [Actinomycetota bacterium]|nr:ABC transporter ATP-binding protein/permease [Actinomycetota bacterium]